MDATSLTGQLKLNLIAVVAKVFKGFACLARGMGYKMQQVFFAMRRRETF
jgi:hypothetical protein